jgi:hypothetical protein
MIRYAKLLAKTAAVVIAMAAGVSAAESPWDVRLPFKAATITYDVSGMESGRETLYIGDYGRKQARFRKTSGKVMFQQMNTDNVQITTEQWHYDIDLAERTGRKTTNPQKYFQQEYEKLSEREKQTVRKNVETMGKSISGGMQGSVEKNAATLLGYPCDKTTYMGTTVYTMSDTGIPLKTVTEMPGMSQQSVAVTFDKGAVDKNVFIPPKDIEIVFDKEADATMQRMAITMMNNLKDPEAARKMQQKKAQAAQQSTERKAPEHGGEREESGDALEQGLESLKGLFGN